MKTKSKMARLLLVALAALLILAIPIVETAKADQYVEDVRVYPDVYDPEDVVTDTYWEITSATGTANEEDGKCTCDVETHAWAIQGECAVAEASGSGVWIKDWTWDGPPGEAPGGTLSWYHWGYGHANAWGHNDISDPEAGANNTGNGTLTKGGAFVAKLPAGVNTRTYWIKFDQGDNLHYSIRFKDNGGSYGNPDSDVYGMYYYNGWQCGSGASYVRTDADCIFKTAKCFIFHDWWENWDQIAENDEFFFNVNANSTTLEMPVLFRKTSSSSERFAVAHTTDHVNCLVDGSTVFTGDPDESPEGVITDYVERLFDKANYNDVNFADSSLYHNQAGDIHCGTNVIRD